MILKLINKFKLIINNSFLKVPSPINLSYMWNFGSFLFFIFLIQLFSGVFLSIFFTNRIIDAFYSIEYIIRRILNGNLIRLIHLNIASLFFICIYYHLFRGLFYSSFKYKNTWRSGVSILLILILTAFIGYVLPWGQISFWAATVITKFLRAIPYLGNFFLIWVWRGFRVGEFTLKFFFSLHFLIPLVLFLFIILHFIALHFKGSSSKIRFTSNLVKIKFFPFFLFKDFLNFIWMLIPFLLLSIWLTREGENFLIANTLVTPSHIKPEWYFLFAYAILRSIPHKLSGVIIIAISIIIFYFVNFIYFKYNYKHFLFTQLFWVMFLLLSWIGYNEAVDLFVILGLRYRFFFFYFFIIFILWRIIINVIF